MRIALASLLATAVLSFPAHAAGEQVKFEGVQEHCVQVGSIHFGANSRWSNCSVTRGRWFATMGILDMYQVQYCLEKGDEGCDRRAFVVFANRAYTPKAQMMFQRIDAGDTQYDDPVLVQTRYGDILTLTSRRSGGESSKSFYLWRDGRWAPIESRSWLKDVARHLPKGSSMTGDLWPDLDSMSVQAKLHQGDDVSRLVAVELAVTNSRFTVKNVNFPQNGE
jgi:hypothetical protein